MLSFIEPKTFKSMLKKIQCWANLNQKALIVQLKKYPSCIPKWFNVKEEYEKVYWDYFIILFKIFKYVTDGSC